MSGKLKIAVSTGGGDAPGLNAVIRSVVLGHLQRGGSPTRFDRLLGTRFGAAAVRFVEQGLFGHMVALDPPIVKAIPLTQAIERMKCVPLDGDTIQTARDLSICLGD